MDEVERLAKEHRPKLLLAGWSRLPARARLPALPRDRRRGRRAADGRHGALRRPGRGGHPPEPGPVRRRRHHDRPQDPRRPALRPDPVPRRSTPRRSTPRSSRASRAARSSTRSRPRRSRSRSPPPTSSRSASSAPSPAPRRWPRSCSTPATGVNVLTGGTDVHLVLVDLRDSELDGQQAEDRLHSDRDHRQPQRGAVRPASADGDQRPAHRHARAGHARPAGRRLPRGRQDHRPRAAARTSTTSRPS